MNLPLKDQLEKLLNLEYVESKEDKRIKVLKKKPDLVDISRVTNIPYIRLKRYYNQGLAILTNLITAYNLFVDYESENLDNFIQKNNVEKLWKKDFVNYSYIPYMGLEEYAILLKFNPKVLKSLKIYE